MNEHENQMSLDKYRKDWFSQNGEDGVIIEIMNRLDVKNGFAVEFGAWDGMYLSNSYHLVSEFGWRAVHIEADTGKYADLLKNPMVLLGRITPENRMISRSGENRLDNVLKCLGVDPEFDLLSIDIDSIDYYIWEGLCQYRPKVVIIEINSSTDPKVRRISSNGYIERCYGNMIDLGLRKGYVAVCHTGNVIFVRDDLVQRLSLSEEELDPDNVFNDRFFRRYDLPRNNILRFLKRAVLKIGRKTIDPYQRLIGTNPYDIYWDEYINEMVGVTAEVVGGSSSIVISTSRPELLSSCVAVAVHPEDDTYRGIVGGNIQIPMFNNIVPIIASPEANPNFESGAMMASLHCDPANYDLVRDLGIRPRISIDQDGKMTGHAGKYRGMSAHMARQAITSELEMMGLLRFRKPLEPTERLSPQHEAVTI